MPPLRCPFYYNKQLPLVAAEDLSRAVYVKDNVEQKVVLPDGHAASGPQG